MGWSLLDCKSNFMLSLRAYACPEEKKVENLEAICRHRDDTKKGSYLIAVPSVISSKRNEIIFSAIIAVQ
jgi:hypothetical protein